MRYPPKTEEMLYPKAASPLSMNLDCDDMKLHLLVTFESEHLGAPKSVLGLEDVNQGTGLRWRPSLDDDRAWPIAVRHYSQKEKESNVWNLGWRRSSALSRVFTNTLVEDARNGRHNFQLYS